MRATLAEREREAAEMRATLAEREREAAARIAVAEERARIARELHDIVAHAMSVMVLQVGAVRHKLPHALEEDREALGRVEQAGRTALAEMRRLLGAMRSERRRRRARARSRASMPRLARGRRHPTPGFRCDCTSTASPIALPRAIDLSAYRIVQEGLTNALKHAHASHADVTVRYRPDEVELEVADDGKGPATTNGLGHGLVGIRERVKIYGGEMSGGSRTGGWLHPQRTPPGRPRTSDEHPRPRRRRPIDGPRRLPHAALRRARHRSRRRGEQRARGRRQGRPLRARPSC